ncbi:MAG: ABC transporter permease [Methylococcaceae bacterium]|nr:ABC transporter permease [Methylococcaceae bacterium]MCI0733039.1 ABC transporter permease [Methylococcaceae bacterium]
MASAGFLSSGSIGNSYEFFLDYVTLSITPMILLSGVFFPLSSLPEGVRLVSAALPLQHTVILVRDLMAGQLTGGDCLHLLVPIIFLLLAGSYVLIRFKIRLQNGIRGLLRNRLEHSPADSPRVTLFLEAVKIFEHEQITRRIRAITRELP